jgi:uncharacterized SAM-binding protein YcdF (DUF218 family)
MTLLLILGLIITAILFAYWKHYKASIATLIIATLSFLLIGSGLPLAALLNCLEVPSAPSQLSWQQHNAIVVLGTGTVKLPLVNTVQPTVLAYSRIVEASRLYRACKKAKHACTIIISGADALSTGIAEAIVYRATLLSIGIDTADIVLEPHSMNTYKNAEFTSPMLKLGHFDQVVLVTSGIHMKRALLYFSHFNIKPIPMPADYIAPLTSVIPLAYNFLITDYAIHEFIGIARFHIYNYMGWNKHSGSPGDP